MPIRPPKTTQIPFLGAALVLAVVFICHAQAWEFICDDAYISFRYARHLAEHGALEFNLGERVEGYTNFLWVVVLALGQLLGLAPERLAPVLTQLSSAVGLWLCTVWVRHLRGAPGPYAASDLLPAGLLAVSPAYIVWSQSGLETAFATTLAVLAMVAWTRQRIVVAAIATSAAVLARPDSAVVIAGYGLGWLLENLIIQLKQNNLGPALRGLPWARVAAAAGVAGLVVGGHFMWRYNYYGSWLPNTWAIKAHGALLRDSHGWPYVSTWVRETGLLYALALTPMIRLRHLKLVLAIAAMAGYVWSVGGDFMAYSRLLLPATTLAGCLCGWLLLDLHRGLLRRLSQRPNNFVLAYKTLATLLVLALVAALGQRAHSTWTRDRQTPEGWLDKRFEGVTAMRRFAAVRVRVGTWMAEHLPPQTRVSVGAAGALPYASDLPTIDAYGLVDPQLAKLGLKPATGPRARPGHQLYAPRQHILGQQPDLLCHVGIVHQRRPGPRDARRRMGPGYAWACIAPGPIDDDSTASGTFAFGNYCCLRKRGEVVGPFGP